MGEKKSERNRELYRRNAIWLKEHKKKIGCQVCGWKEHPEILVIHHKELILRKNGGNRQGFLAKRYSIKRMEKELRKCLILCPNCHAWEHYQDNQFIFKDESIQTSK